MFAKVHRLITMHAPFSPKQETVPMNFETAIQGHR